METATYLYIERNYYWIVLDVWDFIFHFFLFLEQRLGYKSQSLIYTMTSKIRLNVNMKKHTFRPSIANLH